MPSVWSWNCFWNCLHFRSAKLYCQIPWFCCWFGVSFETFWQHNYTRTNIRILDNQDNPGDNLPICLGFVPEKKRSSFQHISSRNRLASRPNRFFKRARNESSFQPLSGNLHVEGFRSTALIVGGSRVSTASARTNLWQAGYPSPLQQTGTFKRGIAGPTHSGKSEENECQKDREILARQMQCRCNSVDLGVDEEDHGDLNWILSCLGVQGKKTKEKDSSNHQQERSKVAS